MVSGYAEQESSVNLHVARYFEEHVSKEEKRQASQVPIIRHSRCLCQPFDFRICDIASVEERQKVQDNHRRQECEIELSDQGGLVDVADLFNVARGVRYLAWRLSRLFVSGIHAG